MDRPLLPFVAIAAIQRKAGSRKNVVVIEASYTAVHPAQPHKEQTFIKFVHDKLANVSEVCYVLVLSKEDLAFCLVLKYFFAHLSIVNHQTTTKQRVVVKSHARHL